MTDEELINQQQEWSDPKKRREFLRLSSNPAVYHCMSLYEHGQMSYQDALELTVCYLVQQNARQFEEMKQLVMALPPAPIVLSGGAFIPEATKPPKS